MVVEWYFAPWRTVKDGGDGLIRSAVFVLLVAVIALLGVLPAGAVHDQFAEETLLIPWHHGGESFTTLVGQPCHGMTALSKASLDTALGFRSQRKQNTAGRRPLGRALQ